VTGTAGCVCATCPGIEQAAWDVAPCVNFLPVPALMMGFYAQVSAPVGDTALPVISIAPGETSTFSKPLAVLPEKTDAQQGATLQIALKWAELSGAPFVMLQVRSSTSNVCSLCTKPQSAHNDALTWRRSDAGVPNMQDTISASLGTGPEPVDPMAGLL
jgi:hypothetical protein